MRIGRAVSLTVAQLDSLRVTDDGQKQMVTGHVTVKNTKGEVLGQMHPAKWFFRKHEQEPTTEVAIHRGFAEDLYLVQAGADFILLGRAAMFGAIAGGEDGVVVQPHQPAGPRGRQAGHAQGDRDRLRENQPEPLQHPNIPIKP